jgi:hypothetical protein
MNISRRSDIQYHLILYKSTFNENDTLTRIIVQKSLIFSADFLLVVR